MTVTAMALFGSKARGDDTEGSDTDILLWTDEPYPRHEKVGPVSMAFYPEADLLGKAMAGDLFAAHIVREAVALHDPDGKLPELRGAFRPPASYLPQITAASDLAWFLVDHQTALLPALANARMAWCVRTIAIARTAERGRFAFSAPALKAALGAEALLDLIGLKERCERVEGSATLLERFTLEHGGDRPLAGEHPSVRIYKRHFTTTSNGFGVKTIRQAGLRSPDGGYI